jgi:hypothetical protein
VRIDHFDNLVPASRGIARDIRCRARHRQRSFEVFKSRVDESFTTNVLRLASQTR